MSLAFALTPLRIDVVSDVRDIVQADLPKLVDDIDSGKLYPGDFLRTIGAAGAFSTHAQAHECVDLNIAIDAMSEVSEVCGSTSFMTWCQSTLVWYLANTDNQALKEKYLDAAAAGTMLGGTGLSNPMKSFFGIEKMKLKGKRVPGGYQVKGALPWVSNIGPEHIFGTIFECEDGGKVMVIADCANEKIELLEVVDGLWRAPPIADLRGDAGVASGQHQRGLVACQGRQGEAAQGAVDQPRRHGLAELLAVAVDLLQRDLQFVKLVVAGLVHARRLAGRADEHAAEQVAQRRVVVPVGDEAGQHVRPAQEGSLGIERVVPEAQVIGAEVGGAVRQQRDAHTNLAHLGHAHGVDDGRPLAALLDEPGAAGSPGRVHDLTPGEGPIAALSRRISGSRARSPVRSLN